MSLPLKDPRSDRWINFVQPLIFSFVGVLNTATDFVVFLVLAALLGSPALANVISYTCGAILSYLLNRNWTFSSEGHKSDHRHSIKAFVLLTLAMIVISTITTVACAEFMPLAIAKLSSVAVVACLSFIGMKFLVFPKKKKAAALETRGT